MVSSSFVYAACFAWPSALAVAPIPGSRTWPPICIYQPWPQFVFTGPGPGPQFVFTSPSTVFLYLPALAPNLYLPALVPDLCLQALVPNLKLPTLVYNFITSLGPEFCIYGPCVCIYVLGSQFVLPVWGLNLHLSYYL